MTDTDLPWGPIEITELPSEVKADELGGHGLGGSRLVCVAPLGWAVAGSSGWVVFVLATLASENVGPSRVHQREQRGTGSSLQDAMRQASSALIEAMKERYNAILEWQLEPETAGSPWNDGGKVFLSPAAASYVSGLHWSTHAIDLSCLGVTSVGVVRLLDQLDDVARMNAHGVGATPERAQRMARDSLAEVTEYRAEVLREWLEEHKPAAPVTYLDVLRQVGIHLGDPEVAKSKVEVSFEGGSMRIVLTIAGYELPENFAVENKRVFEGPLFCHTCGLPAVPFGGEDICLDPEHDREERDDDRDRDDDDEEDEDL